MPSYPTSAKVFTTKNTNDVVQASHVNDLQDEVAAIESGLLSGTAPIVSSHASVAGLQVTGGSTFTGNILVTSSATIPNAYVFASLVSDGSAGFFGPTAFHNTVEFGFPVSMSLGSTSSVQFESTQGGPVFRLNSRLLSTPDAPASTGGAAIYLGDNGAGKTVLVVRFRTGAAQVIATEP